MMRLALDVGHGWTKFCTDTTRDRFPSLIAPAPPTVDLGDLAESPVVWIDDAPYLVGEAARPYATPLWTRDKADDPDTLRLMLVAAARAGVCGPIALATGLPLAWYGSQRTAFRDTLLGLRGTVRWHRNGPAMSIQVASVTLLPQAAAGAIATWSQPVTAPDQTLVVDIGYRTSDYLVVRRKPGRPLDFALDLSGTVETGMSAVAATLANQLADAYQIDVAWGEVESASTLTIRGQRIELGPARQQALDAVAHRLVYDLRVRLQAQWDRLDAILLLGGGAVALAERLRPALPAPVHLPPHAQWANAQGYFGSIPSVAEAAQDA